MNARLGKLESFATIVKCGGFRAAALELGVSSSALSQSINGLEEELGIRLLNRTTRSVAPTEAGEQLLEHLQPALSSIRFAIDQLNQLRERPTGTIRINAPAPAVDHTLLPLARDFMERYPEIKIELFSEAAIVDIVQQGFDAGVRFGKQLDQDMIAAPLGPQLRYVIVGSPKYLSEHPKPVVPDDLINHDCIRRRFPGGTVAKWEFEKSGEKIVLTPGGRLTLSSAHQEVQAALSGCGLAQVFAPYVHAHLMDGSLVPLLEDWCPILPCWFIYYPNKKLPSAAMRAFLDFIREYDWKAPLPAIVHAAD